MAAGRGCRWRRWGRAPASEDGYAPLLPRTDPGREADRCLGPGAPDRAVAGHPGKVSAWVTGGPEAATSGSAPPTAKPPLTRSRGGAWIAMLQVTRGPGRAMATVIERDATSSGDGAGRVARRGPPAWSRTLPRSVGKTMLARNLVASVRSIPTVRRVQFTLTCSQRYHRSDVWNQDLRGFEFRPGAIFANVVVGDGINRASQDPVRAGSRWRRR